ncbi:MAG: hypothetical protein A2X23_11540 [Chloroflexi bacterium GWC2_73_18]|nr:MAG: hypothetical protein A2X23_11540 [Chloroflexi bacterium GWC2_73_18]
MVPEAIAFIAVLGVAVAWLAAVAVSRGDAISRIREALGVASSADPEVAVRAALDGRTAAEWEAAQRAADLAYLIDLIGIGIIRLDDDLAVRLANEAAHVLLGRRPGSLIGRSAIEAFGDHRLEEVVAGARATGAAHAEATIHESGEPTLVVRARRSPATGIWVVMENVSELRRLQRLRAEFIDNLSHELRTPLTTIRLLAETLTRDLDRVEVPARMRDGIAKIDVETGHLAQTVAELLDLARIEEGVASIYLDRVDLASVIRGSVERLRLFAQRQGVTLRATLPAELPPVRGDDERLGQLLLNLLHNAVKFSDPGDEVEVTAHAGRDEVIVSVRDEGIGVPQADLERIFERFYKVDRVRPRGRGGTGLGLAIARQIAESHGGRIWVESREGEGSTFSFVIPVEREA